MAEAPRISLATTISTRDSTMDYDGILYNYYASKNTNGQMITERRFGYQVQRNFFTTGASLGFFTFGSHLLTIIGTNFYVDNVVKGTVNSGSAYQFTLIGFGGVQVFFKNNTNAYLWDGTTFSTITDPNYPAVTTPGVAFIDGYVCVQDTKGVIWNSELNLPGTWNALNFIQGSSFSDPGAAIGRLYAYVVSFGQYSCSFFVDANAATTVGSPFLPNIAAQASVGCANGNSVVVTENTIFWIGQTHQKGRRVYMLNGLVPQAVSDQFIDKVLNADPLTNIYAYYIEINGHAFYVLTLVASNVTLVYDATTGMWARWSSTAPGTQLTVTTFSLNNGIITLTILNHGIVNGDVVNVTSSNSSPNYLGIVVPTVIDANTISYNVNNLVLGGINSNTIDTFTINNDSVNTNPATGIGQLYVTPYVQNYFRAVFYTPLNGSDLLLDVSNGLAYVMTQGVSNDNGNFIYGLLRTNAGDFNSNKMKFFPTIDIIADKVSDTAYIGYSDDDFQTFGAFRPVNLQAKRSMLKRCAAARRRAFSVLYIGGADPRFYSIELLDMVEGPL
jgi:hypothetical protein